MIILKKAPKINQNELDSTYETWCSQKEIKWDESAENIYNLIRGCDPQPGAWTLINSKKVFLYDCKLLKNNLKINNRELFFSEKEVSIGINDKKLIIGRMKTEKEKKISSIEWIKNNEINLMTKVG